MTHVLQTFINPNLDYEPRRGEDDFYLKVCSTRRLFQLLGLKKLLVAYLIAINYHKQHLNYCEHLLLSAQLAEDPIEMGVRTFLFICCYPHKL